MISSKHGKELFDIADNLWEREFIFLPHVPLRILSISKLKNQPGKTDAWGGYPLKGRLGPRGEQLINKHPEYYVIELVDLQDDQYTQAFTQLQELKRQHGPIETDCDSS